MEAFVKSSMAEETRTKLKKILYEDILKCEQIDQIKVIKDIAIMEKEIYDSIQNGDKKYFKHVKIKSQYVEMFMDNFMIFSTFLRKTVSQVRKIGISLMEIL